MAILQNLVIVATGIFSGAAVYISMVEHPARMSLGSATARQEFAPAYRRGAVMQAGLAAFVALGSFALWLNNTPLQDTGAMLWLINGLGFAAIILMTLIVMMPTNTILIGDESLSAEKAERLLRTWARWHGVRSAVSLAMFVMLCFAW